MPLAVVSAETLLIPVSEKVLEIMDMDPAALSVLFEVFSSLFSMVIFPFDGFVALSVIEPTLPLASSFEFTSVMLPASDSILKEPALLPCSLSTLMLTFVKVISFLALNRIFAASPDKRLTTNGSGDTPQGATQE